MKQKKRGLAVFLAMLLSVALTFALTACFPELEGGGGEVGDNPQIPEFAQTAPESTEQLVTTIEGAGYTEVKQVTDSGMTVVTATKTVNGTEYTLIATNFGAGLVQAQFDQAKAQWYDGTELRISGVSDFNLNDTAMSFSYLGNKYFWSIAGDWMFVEATLDNLGNGGDDAPTTLPTSLQFALFGLSAALPEITGTLDASDFDVAGTLYLKWIDSDDASYQGLKAYLTNLEFSQAGTETDNTSLTAYVAVNGDTGVMVEITLYKTTDGEYEAGAIEMIATFIELPGNGTVADWPSGLPEVPETWSFGGRIASGDAYEGFIAGFYVMGDMRAQIDAYCGLLESAGFTSVDDSEELLDGIIIISREYRDTEGRVVTVSYSGLAVVVSGIVNVSYYKIP